MICGSLPFESGSLYCVAVAVNAKLAFLVEHMIDVDIQLVNLPLNVKKHLASLQVVGSRNGTIWGGSREWAPCTGAQEH